MTGYRRPRKVYKLVFEDPSMGGLEVRATGVSLGTLTDLVKLAEQAKDRTSAEALAAFGELVDGFGKALRSWNLEDDDGPVPATVDGLVAQDADFAMEIILAWMEAIAGVSGPLVRRSSGGGPSPEASIPMEVLSPSLAS